MHNLYNNIVIVTNYLTHYYYHKASLVAKFGMFYKKCISECFLAFTLHIVKKYIIYTRHLSPRVKNNRNNYPLILISDA